MRWRESILYVVQQLSHHHKSVAVMQLRKRQPAVATTEMRNEKVTSQKLEQNGETGQTRRTADSSRDKSACGISIRT